MNSKIKNIVVCVSVAAFILVFTLLCLFMPKPEFLDSERREPAAFPELSLESIMKDGLEYGDSFMKQFDDKYTPDNFPFRDFFRQLKAFVGANVFFQKDKDGIFIEDGYAAEMQEEIDDASVAHAADRMGFIYETYLKPLGITPYISIVPDKAYFLAEQNGYLSMDYSKFIEQVLQSVDFADYIDITGALSVEDYYKSDTHWRQEQLTDVAALIVNGMGGSYTAQFDKNTLDVPFWGVYAGRAPRPLDSETMYYLTNENMASIKVYDHENNREISLYDMEKAHGKDAYDMYLGGELSLVTIENPNAKTDSHLIVFRDSYGRSLIPLLTEDYAKITVIDTRYLHPMMLKNYVNFEGADVLFLYSTLVLNASSEMK